MTTAQWANIGDDPGALHALIERIPEQCTIPEIDYLWLFPARRVAIGDSVVVVIGVFDEDPERRRVRTAHFTVARDRKGAATVNARFDEHGSAPVAAVPRIVQGVLRRLGEDAEASPREEQIGGDYERWDALIVELGGAPRSAEPLVQPGAATDHVDAPDADPHADSIAESDPGADSSPQSDPPAGSSKPAADRP
ncbi:MAG: hypothetical protein ACRELT_01285 [Longimicrobiales bacterium]